jgi:uncharacterized membrane protein YjjP (DUF1212 family)
MVSGAFSTTSFRRLPVAAGPVIAGAVIDFRSDVTVNRCSPMPPIDLAIETALLVMRNGGSTVAADRTFTNILAGSQQSGSAIWRLDFVAATHSSGDHSSAIVRPVGPIKVNLVRASTLAILGEQVARGEVPVAALPSELARITQLPSPYSGGVLAANAAFVAACFSQLYGGDVGGLGLASLAAAVGQILRSQLYSRDVRVGPTTLVCGVLSALVASVGLRLGFSQAAPPTLMASVMYMVPGLPLINGFVDVVSQRHLLVGSERIVNASFLFLVLAIAIAFAYVVVF